MKFIMKQLLIFTFLFLLCQNSFSQVSGSGSVHKYIRYNMGGEFIGYERNIHHQLYSTTNSVEDFMSVSVIDAPIQMSVYTINELGNRAYAFNQILDGGTFANPEQYEFSLTFLMKNTAYHVEIYNASHLEDAIAYYNYSISSANIPCYPPTVEFEPYCDLSNPSVFYVLPQVLDDGFYGVDEELDIVDQVGNRLSTLPDPFFVYNNNFVANFTIETPTGSCNDIIVNGITSNCNTLLQPNDECMDAIELNLENEFCYNGKTSYVGTLAATSTLSNPTCSVGGNDVWYKVQNNTGFSTDITINRIAEAGKTYEVYKGASCASMTYVDCGNRNNTTISNVAAGDYVYVRVWDEGNDVQFEYVHFCAFIQSQILNDECVNATDLDVNPTMVPNTPLKLTAESFGATTSTTATCPGNDVWFSFIATNTTHVIDISNIFSSGSPFDGSITHELLSGNCGSLTSIYCTEDERSYAGNLIPNQTYFIRIQGTDVASDRKFDISVLTPISIENDECSDAEFLSQNDTSYYYSGSTLTATASMSGCLAGSTADDDVWYQFIATTTSQSLGLSSLNIEFGTSDLLAYELFSGECGSLSSQSCGFVSMDTEAEFSSLNPGSIYYFRLYSYSADSYLSYVLEFEGIAPPATDTCMGAVHLTVNSDMNCNITHLITNKAAVLENGTGCFGDMVQDTWYTFTAAGTNMYFNAVSEFAPVSFEVYDNDCENLNSLGCGQGNLTLSGLTDGTDYLVRMMTATGDEENYEICIRTLPDAPINDNCNGATSLVVNSGNCNNATAGTFLSSTGFGNDCFGSSVSLDVWYSFTASNTTHWLEVSDVVSAFTGMEGFTSIAYEAYSGNDCNTLSSFLCVDDISFNNQEMTGLTVNETYWIRIFQDEFSDASNFNICLKDTSPPDNDESTGAFELVQAAEDLFCSNMQTFTFQYATQSTPANSCDGMTGNADDDVWFSFKAATTNPTIEATFQFGQAIIELYEADASTYISCSGFGQLNATGLTIGNTYYFRVYDFDDASMAFGFEFDVCVRGLPSGMISTSSNVDPTMCVISDGGVTSSASNTWLHITHGGQLVASVFDSESLGVINSEFYVNNSGMVRTVNGTEYLDRNFEITPTLQPTGNILVRFYITDAEFQALSTASPDVSMPSDLSIIRYSGTDCDNVQSNTIGNIHPVINWGQLASFDYFVDVEIDHFSSFFFQGGTPLPVELSAFNAELNNNDILLTWNTSAEINNAGFQVERSLNNEDFENIGWINGAGNSASEKRYSFLDNNIQNNGTYYYRLLQIDLDGGMEYSDILSINIEHYKGQSMNIFPNPASDIIHFNVKGNNNNETTIHLYNIMGQEIMTRSIEENTTLEIPTHSLKSGTYFAILKNGNQITDSQKVMILQ